MAGMMAWLILLPVSAAPGFDELLIENQPGVMIQKEREVRYRRAAAAEIPAVVPQPLEYDDILRTLVLSRAAIRLNDRSHLRLRELTQLEIRRQTNNPSLPALSLRAGAVHVTSRGGPQSFPLSTPHARAVPRGTEFVVTVDLGADRTEVTMFDGEAELSDGQSTRTVRSGQQGIVAPGRGIVIRSLLEAQNLVQWWIYYPAVLDLAELGLEPDAALEASVAAYRAGDLIGALVQYPGYPDPVSPASAPGRSYLAALFLAVGAMERAERELAEVAPTFLPARALRIMIRAVRNAPDIPGSGAPEAWAEAAAESASEQLARSYAHQRTNQLAAALVAARAATAQSPTFGFAWARVAELEFSFGRTRAARAAIERALTCAPRHAQAQALRGFLLAADNRLREALAAFDAAIALDPALGNAWLGRGLCKRRLGGFGAVERPVEGAAPEPPDNRKLPVRTPPRRTAAAAGGEGESVIRPPAWIEDIETAAALEPRRSLLRSYVGKAFLDLGLHELARKELAYARALDPNDPTPWLYAALLNQEEHRINVAVDELERSMALNDHRAVYRSRFLLDEDRAVRSSSLASVYAAAGLEEVAQREAARAVSYDYANYSAHLFLSESYNVYRDPSRFYLRYETPWFSELLLANLLAPVGGTPLSPHISQQEYSRMFAHDRVGLSSDTLYRSDRQLRQITSQYGTLGSTAWSLDLDYQHNDGIRTNVNLDSIEWYTTIKQQLTARDSVLLLAKYQDYSSGNNFQYYNPNQGSPYYRFDEVQAPILLGGYHREWAPGVHTLLLGGRLHLESEVNDRHVQIPVLIRTWQNTQFIVAPYQDWYYAKDFEAGTVELNQIVQTERHTFNLGARYQAGRFECESLQVPNPPNLPFGILHAASDEPFERLVAYGYYSLKPVDPLVLQAGLAYDSVTFPTTVRNPPANPGTTKRDQFGPKASVVWAPSVWATLRGAYSRSLGGVTLDQSYRLEPTQLAGIVQTYRELVPLLGPIPADAQEIAGTALDLRLGSRTYAGVQADWLSSEAERRLGMGAIDFVFFDFSPTQVATVREDVKYLERSVTANMHHLIGRWWSLGAHYTFTRSELDQGMPEMSVDSTPYVYYKRSADLHRAGGFGQWNHDSGLFAQAGLDWYWQQAQERHTTTRYGWVTEPVVANDFPQVNVLAGWRFPRQHGEFVVGILNLTDTDYRLKPLNFYLEMPHERVFYVQVRWRL